MKRLFLAGLAVCFFVGTGCVAVRVPHHGSSRSALSADECPPGHRWSDGKCHDRGKGHDKHKHKHKKGKKKGRK